jgi:hypothetical protein
LPVAFENGERDCAAASITAREEGPLRAKDKCRL